MDVELTDIMVDYTVQSKIFRKKQPTTALEENEVI